MAPTSLLIAPNEASFEVIVVDDGSTMENRTAGEAITAEHGFTCIAQQQAGLAAARNAGAERAARFEANLLPQGLRADSFDHWVNILRDTNRRSSDYRIGLIRGILVTDDRERDWPSVRVAERYRMELYQRFFEESGEGMGTEGDRIPQTWIVGDVETCVEALHEFIVEFGMTDLVTWGAPPGLRPAEMNNSLEKLFRDVVPRVRERLNANG